MRYPLAAQFALLVLATGCATTTTAPFAPVSPLAVTNGQQQAVSELVTAAALPAGYRVSLERPFSSPCDASGGSAQIAIFTGSVTAIEQITVFTSKRAAARSFTAITHGYCAGNRMPPTTEAIAPGPHVGDRAVFHHDAYQSRHFATGRIQAGAAVIFITVSAPAAIQARRALDTLSRACTKVSLGIAK
jgi:hypothetical protein